MPKFFTQLLVLGVLGVAFCQGITESLPVGTSDSTIVNTASSAADTAKGNTNPENGTKGIDWDVGPDSEATVLPKNTSATTEDLDTEQNSSDTTDLSGGQGENRDSAKTVISSAKQSKPDKKNVGGRNGIGVNMTLKLIASSALNNYLDDLYEKMKDDANGTISDESGFSAMPIMIGLKVKGIVYVGPVFVLEPFGAFNYGVKLMRIRNLDKDVTTNLMEYGGGLNMWVRISPARIASFKTGLGGYFTYSYLNVESYDGTVNHTGFGGGINLLAGVDINLKKITINVDMSVPIGSTELSQDGSFTNRGNNQIRYPDSYSHTGIEIRPGVTFHF